MKKTYCSSISAVPTLRNVTAEVHFWGYGSSYQLPGCDWRRMLWKGIQGPRFGYQDTTWGIVMMMWTTIIYCIVFCIIQRSQVHLYGTINQVSRTCYMCTLQYYTALAYISNSSNCIMHYSFYHANLLTILGYCCDPPALVYPLMVSLFHKLHVEVFFV